MLNKISRKAEELFDKDKLNNVKPQDGRLQDMNKCISIIDIVSLLPEIYETKSEFEGPYLICTVFYDKRTSGTQEGKFTCGMVHDKKGNKTQNCQT